MDKNISWFIEKQIDKTLDGLSKNNMKGIFVKDEGKLLTVIKELIAENSVVGVGDSGCWIYCVMGITIF